MIQEQSIDKKLEEKLSHLAKTQDEKYRKLNLKFNPFPKSGTANVNSSDFYTQHLEPFKPEIKDKLIDYIVNCFSVDENDVGNTLNTTVITGDYGLGKTQLLMYAKYLLGIISQDSIINKKPFVIYIDNPGAKLSEFIGSIISKIGEENFKKFLWGKVVNRIVNNDSYKERLRRYHNAGSLVFNDHPDPYDPVNKVSHKAFLDSWYKSMNPRLKKDFESEFRIIKIEILESEFKNAALAQYFLDVVSNDLGINKSWEALASGDIKNLERKENLILKSIVQLIKEQGFTDFFILVDEFEDITSGRLNKQQVDNYLYNLRLLLDDHREWCLLFAMTGLALNNIKKISPPLADRIGMSVINLTKLEQEQVEFLTINYLNLGREGAMSDTAPFTKEALLTLNEKVEGSTRRFLKGCFNLIEKAATTLDEGQSIDSDFVIANLNIDFE